MLGASPGATCGVRDHAGILSAALEPEGISCSTHWLTREQESLAAARERMRAWGRAVRADLESSRPDAVLLHYSVFSFSYRGFPLLTHPLLAMLRRVGAPLLSVLHEYAYPWGRDGALGAGWAVTQRAALIELVRASGAIAVTTDDRARWLRSRRWLPRRDITVTPIFSNLPPATETATPHNATPTIGIFGYSYGAAVSTLVCGALRRLQDEGRGGRLLMVGAPGRGSDAGGEWVGSAEAAGLATEPGFSGRLELAELANALAGCEILLNADPSGPSSRKTTLAAALASGRPVIALDGPSRWAQLAEQWGGPARRARRTSARRRVAGADR